MMVTPEGRKLMTKKELREMYKNDPKKLYLLGVDIEPQSGDDDDLVALEDELSTTIYVDPFDEEEISNDDEDALLREFGF